MLVARWLYLARRKKKNEIWLIQCTRFSSILFKLVNIRHKWWMVLIRAMVTRFRIRWKMPHWIEHQSFTWCKILYHCMINHSPFVYDFTHASHSPPTPPKEKLSFKLVTFYQSNRITERKSWTIFIPHLHRHLHTIWFLDPEKMMFDKLPTLNLWGPAPGPPWSPLLQLWTPFP